MKIVFAIDTNTAGGGERVIATLANCMSQKGHDTYLINSDSESSFYSISNKVTIVKMELDREQTRKVQRFIRKYRFLKNFFKSNKPDAVVAFLFNMEAPAILAGIMTHTRVFTSVRNAAWSYSKKERLFRRLFYPMISGVVFQSEKVKMYKDYQHLKNTAIIMNPITNDIKKVIQPVPYSERRNIIISVGRLEKQKNHEMLIRAFSMICDKFPDYELHIFGEGSLRTYLIGIIKHLGLESKVTLKGTVSDAILQNRDAKLFVMSSNFEGFPNALAESMIYGIPSISTDFDTGVASELIKEGVNGWLVHVGDIEGLAAKMEYVLSQEEQTDKIANECSKLYNKLNSEVICDQWERFISSGKWHRGIT